MPHNSIGNIAKDLMKLHPAVQAYNIVTKKDEPKTTSRTSIDITLAKREAEKVAANKRMLEQKKRDRAKQLRLKAIQNSGSTANFSSMMKRLKEKDANKK